MRKRIKIDGIELIVSDDGRVWTPERDVVYSNGRKHHYNEYELKPCTNSHGYKQVCFPRFHKTFTIHRLIAITFIPNPNNSPYINHIDGDKQNNHVSNIEWCTHEQNMEHAKKHNLFGKCKPVLCIETGKRYSSVKKTADDLGISPGGISNVLSGRYKSIKGYHFKFIES